MNIIKAPTIVSSTQKAKINISKEGLQEKVS
jgi:hypothetical protein